MKSKTLKLHISISYVVTFLLLLIVMMELHEIVHIAIGRLICGCWGPRDFNVWSLCASCPNEESYGWLATIAGPVFSFSMMWWGWSLLSSDNERRNLLGYAFIFSNIPFGRVTTVMMGGGDEMVVMRHFFVGVLTRTEMIVACSTLLLIITIPPVMRAFRQLKNKWAWVYVVCFLTMPLAFLLVYTLIGLNSLLSAGFLSDVWMMGTPLLITLHTGVAFLLLLVLRKNLY